MTSMVCENCFDDEYISQYIKLLGEPVEACANCSAKDVHGVSPPFLADVVSPVVGLYHESSEDDAQPLQGFLRRDWQLFGPISEEKCNSVLDAIFPEKPISSKNFKSRQHSNSRLVLWDDFQAELKHKNRFFPKTQIIDPIDFNKLLTFLTAKDIPLEFFRARICEPNQPLSSDKMGKPPELLSKGGRANPIGISYLYTASDANTAIAEIRPSVGDWISVAKFTVSSLPLLVDLRNPRKASPFRIAAEEKDEMLMMYLDELSFLGKLGERLSKPKEADLEYLASQYLCEMIKGFGYGGVLYSSSLGTGFNVAFFDDSGLSVSPNIETHIVQAVQYTAPLI